MQRVLAQVRKVRYPRTRILITHWQPPVGQPLPGPEGIGSQKSHLASKLAFGARHRKPAAIGRVRNIPQNPPAAVSVYLPPASGFMNRFVAHLPLFNRFASTVSSTPACGEPAGGCVLEIHCHGGDSRTQRSRQHRKRGAPAARVRQTRGNGVCGRPQHRQYVGNHSGSTEKIRRHARHKNRPAGRKRQGRRRTQRALRWPPAIS